MCGALIGPSSADASTSARDVVDCAPMFHGDVTTTPYFEIALEQIETWASREGRTIVGAYYANARDGDGTPPACVAGTLDTLSARLRRAFGKENIDAFGMLIDATSLERVATAKDGETCAFRVVERDAEGEWTPSERARARRSRPVENPPCARACVERSTMNPPSRSTCAISTITLTI